MQTIDSQYSNVLEVLADLTSAVRALHRAPTERAIRLAEADLEMYASELSGELEFLRLRKRLER